MIPLVFPPAAAAAVPTHDVDSFRRPRRANGQGLNFNACDAERTSRASPYDWRTKPRKARNDSVGVMNAARQAGYTEPSAGIEIATPLKSGPTP
jgi:hypothetical protein